MNPKFTFIILFFSLCFSVQIKAQYYYHYEDFLNDSAFIVKNNIKIVNIRIPEIMGDTSKGFYPYQKLCFNPYGKLAWYEYDYIENNSRRKYYYLHYYNEQALRFKSRIFQRCEGIDSLREEVRYMHDENGRLIHEDHYQIFIQAYNEWSYDYAWVGDSLKLKMDDSGVLDTIRINNKGKEIEYNYNNMRCQTQYDEKGRRKQARYFWQNTQQTDEYKVDEAHFIYDIEDKLARIETDSCIITFYYDENGLPTSSMGVSKFDGQKMQYMIFYDYEFRDGSSVAKRN
jgi:hypothetical protein